MMSSSVWFLDVPFEWRPAISALGGRWDPVLRQTVWRGPQLPDHLKPFRAQPLSWMWHQQYHANGRHLEPLTPLLPAFKPREHQDVAIECLSKAFKSGSPGFVLADEVGVGKTMSAWGFALKTPKLKTILIVTTSSAQAHWRNTVRHAGWLSTQSVVIINYDRLGQLFQEPEEGLSSTRRKGKRKRLAKQGQAPAYDLVIFDESHKGKNPTSARGLMMRKIEKRAKFCIFASATAGQNPVELVYLASVLSHATNQNIPSTSLEDFASWCATQGLAVSRGDYGKIKWDYNADDLAILKHWLFDGAIPLGIRRLPQDVKGWPALSRQLYPVQLSFEAQQSYATLWEDFIKQERTLGQAVSAKERSSLRETNRLRLRQQSSLLRISNTTEMVSDLLEQGKKVGISVAFRKTLDELVQALQSKGVTVSFIHGQQSANEKEEQRLMFQKVPAQVVVFTVEEAISLHQGEYSPDPYPRVLLVHDIRWSAIQMAQIEGRCHRDGMNAPVMWLVAEDTVDLDIAEVMVNKVAGMKALHGDPTGDMKAIEEVLASCMARSGK